MKITPNSRIELFVMDIDGCISEPYEAFNIDVFAQLRQFGQLAKTNKHYPRISICSGRAYGYVEAVTQAIGLVEPVLFESGGGIFDMSKGEVYWNPKFTDQAELELDKMRGWMRKQCAGRRNLMFDYGKRTQAGVVSLNRPTIDELTKAAEIFAQENCQDVHVFHTHVSIDVVPEGITKDQALAWLGDEMGIKLENMAFIGDTNGDLGALMAVGQSFAPANAFPNVREKVKNVTPSKTIEGVLEAYIACVEANKNVLIKK